MKTGKTLVEMANEVERRAANKVDLLENTKDIRISNDATALRVGDQIINTVTDHTHSQIGTWAEVPRKYYEKMQTQSPALLAANLNTWFTKSDSRRMVRVLDGKARAFLSDRYRRIDNDVIARMALDTLLNMNGVDEQAIASCDVTDRKLYLKVIFRHVTGEVKVGDQVESGIIITNSEIGQGGFEVAPFIHRLVCLNGMKVNDAGINKKHIGTRLQGSGIISYSDDTLKADDRALMLEMRDTINAFGNQASFDKVLEKMKAAAESSKVVNPIKAVEILTSNVGLNQFESNSVLENLIRDGDYSRWGMLNAVTKVANTHDDYDRATELETLGGKILDLPRRDWETIATAA